jgi:hypothetical protein
MCVTSSDSTDVLVNPFSALGSNESTKRHSMTTNRELELSYQFHFSIRGYLPWLIHASQKVVLLSRKGLSGGLDNLEYFQGVYMNRTSIRSVEEGASVALALQRITEHANDIRRFEKEAYAGLEQKPVHTP